MRTRISALVPESDYVEREGRGSAARRARCGGGFAEQVARNVEKCEAPTLLRERLEIRLGIILTVSLRSRA
jgi:hypothetical protein